MSLLAISMASIHTDTVISLQGALFSRKDITLIKVKI
ncbi:hypothetical protein SAMN05421544_10971 [Riemerella columbipharyngis]|uniref:Uncharacterized protein n=1 Tax=Riemerella columbipharyngis TaxID=1071918 RepID=A0A1G7CYR1_9FLAO|nr:hypothetical protein SAMN05421544_10971 [Riemerella columbipharyngis]